MFIIADTNSQAFLDADTCEKLQLIKQIFNFNINLQVFFGKCEIETLYSTHRITVDPSVHAATWKLWKRD